MNLIQNLFQCYRLYVKKNADSISVYKPKHIITLPLLNVHLLTMKILDLPENDVDGDVTIKNPPCSHY